MYYKWKRVGSPSEGGCMRGKKTSKPGSVLHLAKKPMLLVFSVFAVVSKVRRAVSSVPVEGLQCREKAHAGLAGKNFGLNSVLAASTSTNNSFSLRTKKCKCYIF